jgi:hypothetical protein
MHINETSVKQMSPRELGLAVVDILNAHPHYMRSPGVALSSPTDAVAKLRNGVGNFVHVFTPANGFLPTAYTISTIDTGNAVVNEDIRILSLEILQRSIDAQVPPAVAQSSSG